MCDTMYCAAASLGHRSTTVAVQTTFDVAPESDVSEVRDDPFELLEKRVREACLDLAPGRLCSTARARCTYSMLSLRISASLLATAAAAPDPPLVAAHSLMIRSRIIC